MTTSSSDEREINAPDEFFCPITHEIMRHPVMSRSGINYERDAIVLWLRQHQNTCPLTRATLRVSDLVSNRALQSRIEKFWTENEVFDLTTEDPDDDDEDSDILLICLAASMAGKDGADRLLRPKLSSDLLPLVDRIRAQQSAWIQDRCQWVGAGTRS